MDGEFAAAAEREAVDRRDGRHLRIFEALRHLLELGDHLFHLRHVAGCGIEQVAHAATARGGEFDARRSPLELVEHATALFRFLHALHQLQQVRSGGERRLGLPQHERAEIRFGLVHRAQDAVQHFVVDGMHLGLETQDGDVVAGVPHAHRIGFEHGLAVLPCFAQQPRPDRAGVDRPGVSNAAGSALLAGAKEPCGPCTPTRAASVTQAGSGVFAIVLPAAMSAVIQPATCCQPAACQISNGPLSQPKPQRTARVEIARIVGDRLQVQRAVVEHVAESRPQELRLRMLAGVQRGELFRPVAFAQDLFHAVVHLGVGHAILLAVQIQHMDLFADLLVDAFFGLLSQRALVDQVFEPARQLEVLVPGIFGQVLAHGVDHMREHVEPDHIQRAEGRALGATQITACQSIHHVEAEIERLRMMLGGEHGKYADAVGDEVGGIFGAHDTFAHRRNQEGLQLVEQFRFRAFARDQFHQVHVARRIEKVDAAETMAQVFGKCFGQFVDGQAGGVCRENCILTQERSDLAVQVGFPVHAFRDGLDHQVALAQFPQVLIVVGRLDVGELFRAGCGCRFQFLQARQRLVHVAVRVAFLRRQFEQQRLDIGIDQVRGDLRSHHTGSQHCNLSYIKSFHCSFLLVFCFPYRTTSLRKFNFIHWMHGDKRSF